jgi:hypothetical protein
MLVGSHTPSLKHDWDPGSGKLKNQIPPGHHRSSISIIMSQHGVLSRKGRDSFSYCTMNSSPYNGLD